MGSDDARKAVPIFVLPPFCEGLTLSKVIAFTNEKGGVGKTTSVLECAYQAGSRGKSVLVIDLDAQANATRMLLGGMAQEDESRRLGVFDLLTDTTAQATLATALVAAVAAWPNTLLVPADARLGTIDPHLAPRLNREGILRRLLAPLRERFDLVLIDLAPAMTVLTLNALVAADAYVVPTDLSKYSQKGIRTVETVADIIRSSGNNPDLKMLGIFVSGYHKGIARSVRALLAELGTEYQERLLSVRVPHSVTVTESQSLGQPVGRFAPESPVAQSYKALFEAVGP